MYTSNFRISSCRPPRQSGVALAVALIFLVVLTLLGLSALDSTLLESNMARNNQEKNYAFHSAETGLVMGMAAKFNNNGLQDLMRETGVPQLATDPRATGTPVGQSAPLLRKPGESDASKQQPTRAENASAEHKGKGFPPARAKYAADTSSAEKFKSVYFETRSDGVNLAGSEEVRLTLRAGYRMLIPEGGGTATYE